MRQLKTIDLFEVIIYMKRFLSFVLVVLLTPCAALAQECLFCGGDDICDACDGAGYQIVTL